MSFAVKFQTNLSEENRLNKTLVDVLTLDGVLRDGCSIINPVIMVEGDLVNFTEVNYCEIPAFGRKYFVTNIESYRTNILTVSCRVDVLSSFAQEIRNNKGIVHRQQDDWNLYLNDNVIRCYGNPIVNTVTFPKGFNGFSFVMASAGRRGSGISLQGGTYLDESTATGAGNTEEKTTAGLITYALAQVGRPYWFGTYGQVADQSLYDYKSNQYPSYYTDNDFTSQFGQKVHDCVGLIKGYRWSNSPNGAPTYVPSQDVNVRGLWAQCNRNQAPISLETPLPGSVVFTEDNSHCGVYVGNGYVVEARGHVYGVQKNLLSSRNFTKWGIPDWLAYAGVVLSPQT